MIAAAQPADPLAAEWSAFLAACRARRLRTLRRFAEEEIIVPSGPLADTRFRCDTQPALGVWFDLLESRQWKHFAISGPAQDGKSFGGYVIPALYHLFEIGETVVLAAPDGDMIRDKWQIDLLPVIRKTRFKSLLPETGKGSRGGDVGTVQFRNGAMLKFMTGGGGDEERSGFTTRVAIVTETDKLDEIGGTSREGKKIDQVIQRTAVYDERANCYFECTVSTENGFIWQRYTQGTATVLHVPCPHCRAYVPLEREDLHGWREAENEIEAAERAFYACRACGEAIAEDERRDMNRAAVPVHRGQSVDETGQVVGDPPRTDTLGFRWSAANSGFKTAATMGALEWKAIRAVDEDAAETDQRQKYWTLPAKAGVLETTPLVVETLLKRTRADWGRGILRELPDAVIVTMDLGKRLAHWMAGAWWRGGSGHIFDYGRIEIPSDDMTTEKALTIALRDFKGQVVDRGWIGPNETAVHINLMGIDAGWQTNQKVVYAFCAENRPARGRPHRYVATIGHGVTQESRRGYVMPRTKAGVVVQIGANYHITRVASHQVFAFHVNADFWKTYGHDRLSRDADAEGAVTLFWVPPRDKDNSHMDLARHLTAERKVEEFIAGKGLVRKWEAIRRQNHWLDCFYNNCALAAHHGCTALPADERPQADPLRPQPVVAASEYFRS